MRFESAIVFLLLCSTVFTGNLLSSATEGNVEFSSNSSIPCRVYPCQAPSTVARRRFTICGNISSCCVDTICESCVTICVSWLVEGQRTSCTICVSCSIAELPPMYNPKSREHLESSGRLFCFGSNGCRLGAVSIENIALP